MTLTRLDHVGFAVADLDRSVEWYTRVLGAPPTLRKTWDVDYIGEMLGYPGCRIECAFFALPGGGVLELIRFLDPRPGRVDMETYNAGNGHLCLLVDDIHAEHARIAPFAEMRSPAPIEIPWGPYRGGWSCYLRDPDGITIQLMQHPAGGPQLDA